MLGQSQRRLMFAGFNLLALIVIGSVIWLGVFAGGGVGTGGNTPASTASPESTDVAKPTPTYPPATPPFATDPAIGITPDCTLAKMAARYELELSSVDAAVAAERSASEADIATRFPNAKVEDKTAATVATKTFPDLDGRAVLIYLLSGNTGPVPVGPSGQTLGQVQGMCTLVFYDAQTEAYMSTVRHTTFAT